MAGTGHSLKTSGSTSKDTRTPRQGSYILFKVPNRKSKLWGVVTSVNSSSFGGSTYTITHLSTGKSYTIKKDQIVRMARKGEEFTFTHSH